MTELSGLDDLEALRRAGAAIVAAVPLPGARLVAIGWATIDLDRSAGPGSLARSGDVPHADLVRDDLLGARARRIGAMDGIVVVLLEPDTEGRLAASLARFGEGLAAVWVALDPPSDGRTEEPQRPGVGMSRPAQGPFGMERLVVGRPVWGPHLVVVSGRAGTITG